MAQSISNSDLQHLADNGFVVVENFLSKSHQKDLREDVSNLRNLERFQIAKIGHDGMVQDEKTPFKDIRYSETCFIGKTQEPEPMSEARVHIYDILNKLKTEVDTNEIVKQGSCTKNVPSLDANLEELMYAYYPQGGYYRRHRDAESESVSNWRKYSLLLYLNEDWRPNDGGELRIHHDSGGDELPLGELPNFTDIQPKGGTLVLFRSNLCPHEVLDTRRERFAIVGWFLSKEQHDPCANEGSYTAANKINPATLEALQNIRDASPRLAAKLRPQPPTTVTGILGDDFTFPGMAPVPPGPELKTFPDKDARFWEKIATFSAKGCLRTLSLGGSRLRHLTDEHWGQPSLLEDVVTLDLANTDCTEVELLMILKYCSKNLKHLYLGGNGLRDSGIKALLAKADFLNQLVTLDLRYNDITSEGAHALGNFLQPQPNQSFQTKCLCAWNVLYLEGNQIGSDGAKAFVLYGNLTQIYLGQNDIGPEGAAGLAEALTKSNQLKKISLEGNRIGNDGATALIEVLEKLDKEKTLEKLYVDNNGLTKEMSLRLGSAVNSATCIGDGGIFQE